MPKRRRTNKRRKNTRKRKQLRCPKKCCGILVTKCGCLKSCPHCNCHEIKRLRKLLKKCRSKKRR